ncbi:MAG TPA: hypothetical protein VEN30_15285 [Paraburkholderia sp.]|nr:hypothetical protein [Paraburkholderia sp.]
MIKATEIDWVISGHGSTLTSTQPPTTRVPAGMRLVLLAPPGTALTNRLGNALERGTAIDHVVLRQNGRSNAHEPATYAAGADVPNLTLHFIAPRDIAAGGVPHIIGVAQDTTLDSLWSRIIPVQGKTVSVFWAACSNIDGTSGTPVVDLDV